MEKFLVIYIIFLFLLIPHGKGTIEEGNTIYVDDVPGEGPDNPSEDYNNIQGATDNASDGDTIFVYNGIYCEQVIINKSINLIGQNRTETIIDGERKGEVLNILSDSVNIRQIYVKNSKEFKMVIHVKSNNNTIKNVKISGGSGGIRLTKSCNNKIILNHISDCSFGIWMLDSCYSNFIFRNI